jgi:hypothetical protein
MIRKYENDYAEFNIVKKTCRNRQKQLSESMDAKRELNTRSAMIKVRQKLVSSKGHKRNIKVVIKG